MRIYFIILFIIVNLICYYNKIKHSYIFILILFILYAINTQEDTTLVCYDKIKEIFISLLLLLLFYLMIFFKFKEYISLVIIIIVGMILISKNIINCRNDFNI